MKLTKHELIEAVAQDTGITRIQVREVMDSASMVIHDALAAGRDAFVLGLGKLSVTHRGVKRARNIHTGESVIVPPRAAVLFRPSDSIKAAANAEA